MRSPATGLLLISFFLVKFAWSQSGELLVQGQTGKLYLEHTVIAKENWYSVGRLYNLSPKELAAFNHLTLQKTLTIGQVLEIPLTAVNFSQTDKKAPTETLVPLYYIVQEKEWMYRVSVNHNKVPIPTLEKWNHISKDQVRAGLHLIVGFLKVKTSLSALATGAGTTHQAGVAAAPVSKTPVTKQAVSDSPVANPATGKTGGNPPAGQTTGSNPVKSGSAMTGTNGSPSKTGDEGNATATLAHFNGGVFRADYNETDKSISGACGIFKSTSGWQDGKYYALMNGVPVGTIVKVVGSVSGKTVYAKVLGQLPDMKESAGLAIRISNAAASELGETGDGRFNVEVKY